MRHSGQAGDDQPLAWTVRLTVLSALAMLGILALFYATEQKPLAMRLMYDHYKEVINSGGENS